ncbi:hypothetical protein AUC47_10290 [Microbacterium sp. SZ1]|uniref:hypothetical protein n=1 Tax=Microbacterium sp. SZ1 TaxID=1849736 RepID=UPI000BBC3DE1|nr:hypothetical protein [Microbacterium sp. SZ1]PCE15906.1 hypothetical protein AUC47_10290 [Microbacterium sp. SZ1]
MPAREYRDLDARAWAYLENVDTSAELAALRAGTDPRWERPRLNGVDITDRPDLWTPYQRARRTSYEARVAQYRERGLF